MSGHKNTCEKAESMRRLRQERREEGYVEVTLWVSKQDKDRLKEYAEGLLQEAGATFVRPNEVTA